MSGMAAGVQVAPLASTSCLESQNTYIENFRPTVHAGIT